MDIILIFPGFIIAALVVLLYECKIRRIEPRNKVHFYVQREHGNRFTLWVGKTMSSSYFVFADYFFKEFNLNLDDFADMKEGEIREVFINLEDWI